ncbi:MAG: hypothetical protein IJX32_01360 [Spirochaetaceae bacterium]|nr:hypothetical protein [Spirochaetaceae bacterium]
MAEKNIDGIFKKNLKKIRVPKGVKLPFVIFFETDDSLRENVYYLCQRRLKKA